MNDSQSQYSIAPSQNPSQVHMRGGRGGEELNKEIVLPSNTQLPDIRQPYTINMQDANIKSKFGAWESVKAAVSKKQATVDQIREKPALFSFEDMYSDPENQQHGVKLEIKGTGIMEMDEYVLHPFVRIHIIDMNTKKYLAKSDPIQPGIANKESVSFQKISDDSKKIMMKGDANFILPLSTKMYDMRIKGVNYCEWNEEFVINEFAKNIFKSEVLMLFEILDFSPYLIVQGSSMLNADNLYPVAWAFLRPLGTATAHLGRTKL